VYFFSLEYIKPLSNHLKPLSSAEPFISKHLSDPDIAKSSLNSSLKKLIDYFISINLFNDNRTNDPIGNKLRTTFCLLTLLKYLNLSSSQSILYLHVTDPCSAMQLLI
jgi:hypothetical protein